MKIYITKFALMDGVGIIVVDGEIYQSRLVTWKGPSDYFENSAYGEGKEWHRTYESAVELAEIMRKTKIASHKKAIARLEKLKFSRREIGGN